MNKLKLSKLLAAVDIYYKRAGDNAIRPDDVVTNPGGPFKRPEIPTINVHDLPDAAINVHDLPDAKPIKPGAIPFRTDVFKAQQRMHASPYSFQDLEVDGKLGNQTRAYLKTYKKQKGKLNMDDEAAIKALSTEPFLETATPLPTPRPTGEKTWG